MINPNYFGAMMIQYGLADGLVGGAGEYSSGLLRPLLQILKPLPEVRTVFGCMIIEVADRPVGEEGVLFFADGAVIPEPTVEQLATIAAHTSNLYCRLCDSRARVAMLSFSTKGSSGSPAAKRVAAAVALARQKVEERAAAAGEETGVVDIEIDGEMQADTALDAALAQRKAPDSLVAGQANVLVFPRPQQRQHRPQTGAIPGQHLLLRTDPARIVETGGRRVARRDKRRDDPRRGGHRRPASHRIPHALSGLRHRYSRLGVVGEVRHLPTTHHSLRLATNMLALT